MDQGEKMQQVAKDFNDIKAKIQEKYDMVMEKISEYKSKLDEITSNAANQSQQWIDKQTKKIKGKIEELTETMNKAASRLDFETAIKLREEISKLKKQAK